MVVTNPEHRAKTEKIWQLPEGTIADKPGFHAVLQNRMLKDGKLNAYWVQVNNNLQAGANIDQEGLPGYSNPETFVVVSDAYPTVTALGCRSRLPVAMWVEKEGAYGNAERRTHFWHQLVEAPGEGALGSVAVGGVLKALQDRGGLAGRADRQEAGVPRQDAVRRALQERPGRQIPASGRRGGIRERRKRSTSAFTCRRACSRSTQRSAAGMGTTCAPFDTYHQVRGLRWPVVDGKETRWRFREGHDPYVKAGKGYEFYGFPDGKARIFALTLRAACREPRQGAPVLAHDGTRAWSIGIPDR